MIKKCTVCGIEIPEGRLKALPNTTTCTAHSGVKAKRAITVTGGEGEDTFNEILIMEPEAYDMLFGHEDNQRTDDF